MVVQELVKPLQAGTNGYVVEIVSITILLDKLVLANASRYDLEVVATLVIGLPSEHEGGELIVSHDGRQHAIVFTGAASGHETSYAAFYADCQHEIRPVRSGFRLCLTYNVSLAKSRGKKGIAAPSYVATTAAVGELLCDWQSDANAQKLAVTLDHRYTQDGLSIDKLKGIDRAQAEVLFAAAERADCMAHLALVTLWQNGAAEGGYDEYSYGYRRRWSDDEDEDDNYDSQYEMGEIYDHRLSASHWTDIHGKKVRLGEILLEENEIVAEEALDSADPNREEFEGPTGNAGMTLERWYHRAAVLIWPRTQHFHVLCSAGTDASFSAHLSFPISCAHSCAVCGTNVTTTNHLPNIQNKVTTVSLWRSKPNRLLHSLRKSRN